MARTHEDWIAEIFAGLDAAEIEHLMALLAKTKASARKAMNGGARMIANPVTLPLSDYKAQHVRLDGRRQGRDADAQPAGQEEPAHLRELRRDREHLPRRREGQGR